MKIAITGHRPNKLGYDYKLESKLILAIKRELQMLINVEKPTAMISGMALGIDTLWAKLAHENNIRLITAIPCLGQENLWLYESKTLYRNLINHPNTIQGYFKKVRYSSGCM